MLLKDNPLICLWYFLLSQSYYQSPNKKCYLVMSRKQNWNSGMFKRCTLVAGLGNRMNVGLKHKKELKMDHGFLPS
jgi:hypothetical protein